MTICEGMGNDQIAGSFGADTVIEGHGTYFIQDYNAAEGDVLVLGNVNATAVQFQINFANTLNAGSSLVTEAFVI